MNIIPITAAFVICMLVTVLLARSAHRLNLLDHPDSRKQHQSAVPAVGGIAMFIAFSLVSVAFSATIETLMFLGACTLIVVTGVIDDRLDISPKARLLVQLVVALAIILVADIKIHDIGNIFGSGPVAMQGLAAIVFSTFCIIGVTNSINMIDGIDGLAGSTTFLSLAAIATVVWQGGLTTDFTVISIALAVICAFLMLNLGLFGSNNKVFMGDAGSMFLGLILVWFFIRTTQTDAPVLSSVVAGWVFGVPIQGCLPIARWLSCWSLTQPWCLSVLCLTAMRKQNPGCSGPLWP